MKALSLILKKKQKVSEPSLLLNGAKKRSIVVLLFVVVAMLFFFGLKSVPAFAQAPQNPEFGFEYAKDVSILGTQDIRITIFKLINVFLGIVGIVFLGFIIYGGYIFMMSRGDANEIERGKRILRNAIIGLIIIFSALALVQFILQQLGVATGIFSSRTQPSDNNAVLVGGLGNGPIEAHYPARDQEDVPRNTMIVITWKETMNPEFFFANFTDADDNDAISAGDKVTTYKLDTQIISENSYEWDETDARFEDETGAGIPGDEYIGLRNDMIGIFPRDKGVSYALGSEQVRVSMTSDRKTFTFWPVDPIGSPSENMWYQVDVSDDIQKEGGDRAFFSGASGVGYFWNFETSTIIDTTPPKIKNIYPRAKQPLVTEPANVVISIEFDEAINPLTASGIIEIVGGAAKGEYQEIVPNSFQNIEVSYEDPNTEIVYYLAGEFTLANQYKTIEFLPITSCGINACGETVYCLERDLDDNLEYTVNVYAAFLNKNLPQEDDGDYYAYTDASGNAVGITDMAANSFDGNRDGLSQGSLETSQRPKISTDQVASSDPDPWYGYTAMYYMNDPVENTGDDAYWSFMINYDLILDSPEILDVQPNPEEQGVNRETSIAAMWNRVMYSETINSQNVLLPLPPGSSWDGNYWLSSPMEEFLDPDDGLTKDRTRLRIHHGRFPDPTKEPSYEATVFSPEITSGVKDIYQNCFSACRGPQSDDIVTVQVIDKTTGDIVEEYTANYFYADNISSANFYQEYIQDSSFASTYIDEASQPFRSRLFVYRNLGGTKQMGIGIINNKWNTKTSEEGGYASFNFTSNQMNTYFTLEDDNDEFYDQHDSGGSQLSEAASWTEARAEWHWIDSTDGGIFDLPADAVDTGWEVEIEPFFWQEIIAWEFLSAETSGSQAGTSVRQILPLQTIDWAHPEAKYKVKIIYKGSS